MGFVIFVVLVVGYWIFGNFWWLLWMPLSAIVIWLAWILLLVLDGWVESKRTCPVCRNWIRSVILADITDHQKLCNKHTLRRARIWRLEANLGFRSFDYLNRTTDRKELT